MNHLYTSLVIFFVLSVAGLSRDSEPSLLTTMKNAQFVVYGSVESVERSYEYMGKAISEKEAKVLAGKTGDDVAYPVVVYKVAVNIEKVIKGAVSQGKVMFMWRDLAGSRSPHINVNELSKEGLKCYWYSTDPIKEKYVKSSLSVFVSDHSIEEVTKLFY